MIKVENIYKRFGDEEVLKGITTTFQKGKTNVIIGQSGSGKTVFMKCLLGLFAPEEGRIFYEDIAIQDMDKDQKSELRQKMGMLFQGGALFDSMNIEENVMFPLQMFSKSSRAEMMERVNEVLKRVNLENVNKKLPSEISGGMQKRVAIARAIVNNPKYLFCDEPNSGLDPRTATVIDNLIMEITHEYDITTVINTHDMNSVMEIGETIIFLKDGKLVWEGDKSGIFKTDNEAVTDFVYSSDLFQKIRVAQNIESDKL
jgi:phospholipid/cholesterol/gamma-HCH transport system ATP-binding protein